jgi:pentapeptide MXKDX repeat protein
MDTPIIHQIIDDYITSRPQHESQYDVVHKQIYNSYCKQPTLYYERIRLYLNGEQKKPVEMISCNVCHTKYYRFGVHQGYPKCSTCNQQCLVIVRHLYQVPPWVSISQDTISQDTISQDTISQDTISQDTISQDTISQDTISQDTISQDTQIHPSR